MGYAKIFAPQQQATANRINYSGPSALRSRPAVPVLQKAPQNEVSPQQKESRLSGGLTSGLEHLSGLSLDEVKGALSPVKTAKANGEVIKSVIQTKRSEDVVTEEELKSANKGLIGESRLNKSKAQDFYNTSFASGGKVMSEYTNFLERKITKPANEIPRELKYTNKQEITKRNSNVVNSIIRHSSSHYENAYNLETGELKTNGSYQHKEDDPRLPKGVKEPSNSEILWKVINEARVFAKKPPELPIKLKKITIPTIVNAQTLGTILFCDAKYGEEGKINGEGIKPDTDAQALLGTPNGNSAAWILIQHGLEFNGVAIKEITYKGPELSIEYELRGEGGGELKADVGPGELKPGAPGSDKMALPPPKAREVNLLEEFKAVGSTASTGPLLGGAGSSVAPSSVPVTTTAPVSASTSTRSVASTEIDSMASGPTTGSKTPEEDKACCVVQ